MIARYPPLARILYRDYDYVESVDSIAIYKRRADAPPPPNKRHPAAIPLPQILTGS